MGSAQPLSAVQTTHFVPSQIGVSAGQDSQICCSKLQTGVGSAQPLSAVQNTHFVPSQIGVSAGQWQAVSISERTWFAGQAVQEPSEHI